MKITQEIMGRIVAAMKCGAYPETAAAFAGVSKSQLQAWLTHGANNPESDEGKFHFVFSKVMAQVEKDLNETIRRAAMKDWKAAAWLLERKHPERYGKRQVIQIGTGVDHSTELDLANLNDEELALLDHLLGKGAKKDGQEAASVGGQARKGGA